MTAASGGSDQTTAYASLVGSETDVLALNAASSDVENAIYINDTATPANNYVGTIQGYLPATIFPHWKRITLADGSQGYADHNLLIQSEGYSTASWSKTTTTVTDNTGSHTLTATSTASRIAQTVANTVARVSRYHTMSAIVEAGTSRWVYINQAATADARAWFDLQAGVVGTKDVGVYSSNIHMTDFDGAPLPPGRYRIESTVQVTATSLSARLGQSDADNSTSVTSGRTFVIHNKMQLCIGARAVGYITTGAAVVYGMPYDWSMGHRAVLIEEYATGGGSQWGSDLSNAVWTKSNMTAALDAIGPDLLPCTTLTATANNGTATQAVTSSGTAHTTSLFIKRRTGSGTIEVTANNGSTWTDITAQVSSGVWSRPYIHSALANPTIGIRLGTSGDEVYISEFHEVRHAFLASPFPTFSETAATRSADLFRLPLSALPSGSEYTAYFDVDVSPDAAALGNVVGFIGTGQFCYAQRLSSYCSVLIDDDLGTVGPILADGVAGMRMEATIRLRDGDLGVSVNGLGAAYAKAFPSGHVLDNLRVGGPTGRLWLRRLLLVPRDVGDDNIERFRYSGSGRDARYLDDVLVSKDGDSADVLTKREPALTILTDSPSQATGLVTYAEKEATRATDQNIEFPCRLRARPFTLSKSSRRVTLGAATTLAEPVDWADGLGNIQGSVIIKSTLGADEGRIHLLYTQLDSANGLLTPTDHRRIYYSYSDDDMDTWSSPAVVYDPGDGYYAICSPAGDAGEFPSGHVNAGRIVVPFYRDGPSGVQGGILSLDPGGEWTASALVSLDEENEPALTIRPNGNLLIVWRATDSVKAHWSESTDAGATLSDPLDIAGFVSTEEISLSLTQIPGGVGVGRPILSGARTSFPFNRSSLTVEALENDPPVPSGDRFLPWGAARPSGYSSIRAVSGGMALLATEAAKNSSFNDFNSIRLLVLDVREL